MIKSKSCTFFGNIYTPQGIKPDPKKVEAIKKMEAPQTKQVFTILSWHGKLFRSIHQEHSIAELTANLRLLLRKDALFQWTEIHEANFQKVKDTSAVDACLMYFNSSKPVILQINVSKLGLGG